MFLFNKKIVIILLVLSCIHCSSPVKSEGERVERVNNNENLSAINSQLESLNQKVEQLSQETDEHKEDDEQNEVHGHETGSHTDVETLKLLQKINQKIMVLEQKLSSHNNNVDESVLSRQIVEVARKTLAEHSDVGPGYVSNPSNIIITKDPENNFWHVNIRFKLSRQESDVYNAKMRCYHVNSIIECKDVDIKAE